MLMNIIIEPEYKDTVWCNETLSGIEKKAASLRYKTKICSNDTLNADMKNVIIIGTSPNWVSSTLYKTSQLGINTIVISCQPIEAKGDASYVLIEHNSATRKCIDYLRQCGRNGIALYGINRNSYADMIKTKYFDCKNIYYSTGEKAMQDCCKTFEKEAKHYNAVICSNYIAAIYLMNRLKATDISVPNDLYVIAYGDSVLGNMFNPSLTTVTLDHEQLGIQAVNLCRFPDFLLGNIHATIYVPSEIHAAKSTDNIPYLKSADNINNFNLSDNIFTEDIQIKEIQSFEKLLRACDSTDFKIIDGLLANEPYSKIGELLYISESSVKYRIKRMLSSSGIEAPSKILELYTKYLKK